MTKKKKIIIIVVAIILALSITAGAIFAFWWFGDDTPAKGKKKKVVVIKQYPSSDVENTDDNLQDDNTQDDGGDDTNDDYYEAIRRELYQKTQNNVVNYVPEYKVTSKDWNGPNGYVIVIPGGDNNSQKVAEQIQAYFKKYASVDLKIVTDEQKEQKKEILVGNTNRYKSKLSENEYAVKISGDKLIFEGGHYAMLGKAADWFVAEKYTKGKVSTLEGATKDFSSIKEGGYVYVWGDEFSGASLDRNKWNFENRMPGTALLETREDEAVAKVAQDNLQLRAIRSYRKENPVAQYATNKSISSMKTMSFMYGYLEFSARVPFISGAFPSFWANSNGALNNNSSNAYTIEVDFFENFSSVNTIVPNIHKWRGLGIHSQYNSDHYVDGEQVKATPFVFENDDDLSNEYHVYGFKWTETEMTMSVDGKDYMTFDLTKDFDDVGDGMDGFKVPISLLINNYMFVPDYELFNGASNVNNMDLPYEYDIDWVRLYQIPGEGKLNIAD